MTQGAVEHDLQGPGLGEAHGRLENHRPQDDGEPPAIGAQELAEEPAHARLRRLEIGFHAIRDSMSRQPSRRKPKVPSRPIEKDYSRRQWSSFPSASARLRLHQIAYGLWATSSTTTAPEKWNSTGSKSPKSTRRP